MKIAPPALGDTGEPDGTSMAPILDKGVFMLRCGGLRHESWYEPLYGYIRKGSIWGW